MKILVVDDETLIRDVVREYLQLDGFSVEEARDGDEALDKFQQEQFDLVIMDYRLPVLDGIDAMYKIRNSRLEKQPKIIFCSSLLDIEKIEEALDGGADDYVLKPFDEEIIISKLSILGLV